LSLKSTLSRTPHQLSFQKITSSPGEGLNTILMYFKEDWALNLTALRSIPVRSAEYVFYEDNYLL